MASVTARQRLIDAAVEAFSENGFGGTTTRDIASRAEMSPAAVYVHHNSKESLLYSVSLDGHRKALETIRTSYDSASDPVIRIHNIVHDFTYWHAVNSRVGRIVQYEFHALTPGHRSEIAGLRRQIEQTMRESLEARVATDAIEVDDIPGTALALLSLAIDVVRWFEPGGSRTADDLAELNAQLAIRMVTPA